VKLWLRILISAGLFVLLFLLLPWAQVRDALLKLPPGTWAFVLVGFVAGHGVGVFKWRLFVNAGRASLRVRDAVQCYAAGLFANLCLPSIVGGDVLRAAMAAKFTKRPEATFLGGVIDRLTDMMAMVVLIVGGGLFAHSALDGWLQGAMTAAMILGAVAVALFIPLVFRRPLAKWPRKFRRPIGRSLVALRRMLRNPGTAAVALGLSLTIQGSFVLLNAALGHAVGREACAILAVTDSALAKIAGLMPISLGGLAVRETTLAALLTPQPTVRQRQFDVLEHREIADQVETLEDKADFAVADPRALGVAQLRDVLPVEAIGSLRGTVEQAQDRKQGGLPAAGRTGNREVLTLPDLEMHAGKGVSLDLVREEDLGDGFEGDEGAVGVHERSGH